MAHNCVLCKSHPTHECNDVMPSLCEQCMGIYKYFKYVEPVYYMNLLHVAMKNKKPVQEYKPANMLEKIDSSKWNSTDTGTNMFYYGANTGASNYSPVDTNVQSFQDIKGTT